MATFMLFAGGADLDKRSGNTALQSAMLERYTAWLRLLADGGRLTNSYKLFDQTGTRLSVRSGEVVEGPFVETKEAVGGIFVIDVPSLAEATALARSCPIFDLQNGYVEVRTVERG